MCLFILFQLIEDIILRRKSLPEVQQIRSSPLSSPLSSPHPGPSISSSNTITPRKEVFLKRKLNEVEDISYKEVKKSKHNDISIQLKKNNLLLNKLTNAIENNNKQLQIQNEMLEKLNALLVKLDNNVQTFSRNLQKLVKKY